MYCPVCKDTTLVMSERQGIEIDYCPQCRGVWLDRGELDKIIQHSLRDLGAGQPAAMTPPPRQEQAHTAARHEQYGYSPRTEGDRHHYDERRHYKRKKSFWEELFD
ncbi:zf-TFIIB domain-containing protein [Pseudogulbenkiania sp. MAI-1]|uniref:TFIIB-type zinc ribbon-containing protein n=1 Tax=Pseudogulbenkiania sp. MAI-1 TaxID=990370 RepID=UPI00045E76E2|nr:zf-TFIIB domain-containing protein [Pseudogulbenkiania sp. MAI-1]